MGSPQPTFLGLRYHLIGKTLHVWKQLGLKARPWHKARGKDHQSVHPSLGKALYCLDRERYPSLYADADVEPGEITTRLDSQFLQQGQLRFDALRRVVHTIPATTQLGGAPQRWPALPPEDNRRMRLLHWLGVEAHCW